MEASSHSRPPFFFMKQAVVQNLLQKHQNFNGGKELILMAYSCFYDKKGRNFRDFINTTIKNFQKTGFEINSETIANLSIHFSNISTSLSEKENFNESVRFKILSNMAKKLSKTMSEQL